MEFEFLSADHAVVVRDRGRMRPTLLSEWLKALADDPRFDLSMHQIFDLRDMHGLPDTIDEMSRYVDVGSGFNVGRGRVALIMNDPLQFGFARMFEATASPRLERNMAVFQDLESTLDWLRE